MDKLTRAKFCKEFFVEMKSAEGDQKVAECKLCPEGGRKRFLIARGMQTDYMAPEKHLLKHDKSYDVWAREQQEKRRRENPTINISPQAASPEHHKDMIIWKSQCGIPSSALEHSPFRNKIMRGLCSTPPRREKMDELIVEYAGQARTKTCIEFGFKFSDVSVCMDTSTIHHRTMCAVTLVCKGTSMCWTIKPMSSIDAPSFKSLLEQVLVELRSERIFVTRLVSDAGAGIKKGLIMTAEENGIAYICSPCPSFSRPFPKPFVESSTLQIIAPPHFLPRHPSVKPTVPLGSRILLLFLKKEK